MSSFIEYCKDFVKEELPQYEGQKVYACDLGMLVTEGINVNGTCTYSSYDAKEYIKNWWDEAAEYWEYEKYNFGEHFHNPFDEPEAYMVCMVIAGVESLLSGCKVLNDNWNNDFELTAENIKEILAHVETVEKIEW